jgi:hypothetical protein
MSALGFLVAPLVAFVGYLAWRHLLLRPKGVEAALGVLESLDRVRGAFHEARRQEAVMATIPDQRGVTKWRAPQMRAGHESSERLLGDLERARDGLRDAEAKAAALWGDSAKVPLRGVYRHVELLAADTRRYWPKAIRAAEATDARGGDPAFRIEFPQPSTMMQGRRDDEFGGNFEAAVAGARTYYERRRGRVPTPGA